MPAHGGSQDEPAAAIVERMDGPLYTLARFEADDYEVLYVSEATEAMYPDEAAMSDHFSRIFDYVGIDFAEKALFTDVLLPGSGSVRYMTTCLEAVKAVRIYDGARGVFLAVDPDEPVPPLVAVVEDMMF